MKHLFFSVIILMIISCGRKANNQLELNFTSSNGDTITEIKSFYLTRSPIQGNYENIAFQNIKCITPNRFIFGNISTGTYIGLLCIEKKKSVYNISIDAITIKNGVNIISKEINLGVAKL